MDTSKMHRVRVMRVVPLFVVALLVSQSPAFAQNGPNRGGFTVLVNAGLGIQHDAAFEETAVGVSGLNLGVGGFLTEDLGLLFRVSGTTASYDAGPFGDLTQVSGVVGATVQYWVSDRFNLEAGPGVGLWSIDGGGSQEGFGLILGAGLTLFNRGKHNLQVGIEYAPAFTDAGTVNNLGFTFGYQFL